MAQQIVVWLDSWMITCSDTYNEIVDFIVRLGTVVLDTTCLFQFLMVMLPSSLWVIISAFLWQVFLTLLKMTRSSEVSHQLTLLWLDVIVLWSMLQSQELFTYLVTLNLKSLLPNPVNEEMTCYAFCAVWDLIIFHFKC